MAKKTTLTLRRPEGKTKGKKIKVKLKVYRIPKGLLTEKQIKDINNQTQRFRYHYRTAREKLNFFDKALAELGLSAPFASLKIKYKNVNEFRKNLINLKIKQPRKQLKKVTDMYLKNYGLFDVKKYVKQILRNPRKGLYNLFVNSELPDSWKQKMIDDLSKLSDTEISEAFGGGVEISEYLEFLAAF